MNKKHLLIAAFGLPFLAGAAPTTVANTPDAVVPQDADTVRTTLLGEASVVASAREHVALRMQSVSSSTLTEGLVERFGASSLTEAAGLVPSFAMPTYGSRLTSSVYVRGIGSRVNSPAIALYQDGIPVMSKTAFNTHLYDLERIDVLRGPQGTLYGQNAEGGLVNVWTRNPLNYSGTDVRLSLGTRLHRVAELSHFRRFGENVGLGVSAFYSGTNGFYRNQADHSRADRSNEAGAKVRLAARLSSRLTLDVISDFQHTRQHAFAYGEQTDGRTAEPSTNRPSTYRRDIVNSSARLTYAAPSFDLAFATSHQFLRDRMLMDQDYTVLDFMGLEQRQLQHAITEELTAKSRRPVGGFWSWTGGAFFSSQWLKTDAPVIFGSDMNDMLSATITKYAYDGMFNAMVARQVASGVPQAQAEAIVAGIIERAGGCSIRMDMQPVPGLFRTPSTNFGLFHESTFLITPRFAATLGLRFSSDHASIRYATEGIVVLDENVMGTHLAPTITSTLASHTSDTWTQLLPKFGLTYRLGSRGSNVYFNVQKGYRAGGYNIQMFSDILQTELAAAANSARTDVSLEHDAAFYDDVRQTITFKPETSWNHEIGTHLNLGAFAVDASAYLMQVHDQQLSVMASGFGFGRMMINSGRTRSFGFEGQISGTTAADRLTWRASYAYNNATFRTYSDENSAGESISYRGKHVPFAPQHMLSALADYRIDVCPEGTLRAVTVGANVVAQGPVYWDVANAYRQKFYAVLGAHVDADFGVATVSLWGKNLTQTHYDTFAVQSSITGQERSFAQRGLPFQLGVDVRLHF